MSRLVIAVDCDDVLVPTASWIIDAYNDQYGTNLGIADFYSDDIDVWQTDSYQEATARVGALLKTDEYAEIAPFNDAIDAIKQLADTHELHIVTGRASYLESVTRRMMDEYFPGCFQSVEHTGFFEGGKYTKGDVCRAIGADILIDDHLVHLNDVLLAGLKHVVVYGDYPWNQVDRLPEGMRRSPNWQSTQLIIDELANG